MRETSTLKLENIGHLSLITERDERVNASGALGRNEARKQRYAGKNNEHGDESHGIAWLSMEEQGRDVFPRGERDDRTDSDADKREAERATDNAEEDIGAAGTEGHANADFLPLARDHI